MVKNKIFSLNSQRRTFKKKLFNEGEMIISLYRDRTIFVNIILPTYLL